jgi:hypothetical protein
MNEKPVITITEEKVDTRRTTCRGCEFFRYKEQEQTHLQPDWFIAAGGRTWVGYGWCMLLGVAISLRDGKKDDGIPDENCPRGEK